MSLPRYPNYKDSGVAWLGEVPGHWEVDRLKWSTLACKNGIWGDEPQQNEDDIPCVRVADFDRQRLRVELDEPTIRNVTEKERNGRVLNQGDLLLEKSGGGEFQPVGCVVLYDDPLPAVCSNFVARVQVAVGMNASFWRYAHAAAYAVRLNTRSIKQTSGIQNIDQQQYLDELAAFPPHPEQTQIAAFLDRETAKIDELVAEQRRLMALLKEKRQAVISHAVTRGLNPDAPLKPSGIEWLGDVPEHWELKATKRLFRVVVEPAPDDNDHELLSIYTAIGVRPRKELEAKGNKATTTDGYWMVRKGDLIVNKLLAWMGAIGISDYDGVTSPAYDILRKRIPLEPRYYDFLFRCGICFAEFRRYSRGIMDMRLRLYFDELGQLVMPYPPEAEQIEIVKFLQHELTKFDTLSAEAQRAIDLLQERRTALISAAVTGQIDVRGVVSV